MNRHATLHLQVVIDTAQSKDLVVGITEPTSAYALFANGVRVMGNGRPSAVAKEEVPEVRFRQCPFHVDTPRIEFVLEASCHQIEFPGRRFRVRLGSRERMELESLWETIPYYMVTGILLIFTIQYLVFLLPLTREPTHLLFGAFCLTWLIFGVSQPANHSFAGILWPMIPFGVVVRTTLASTALSALLLGCFCQEMFPNPVQRIVNKAFGAATLLLGLVIILAPLPWAVRISPVVTLFGFVQLGSSTRSLLVAVHRKWAGSAIFATGFAIFVAATIRDGLILAGVVHGKFGMFLGSAALAVAESFALSRRFILANRSNLVLLGEVRSQNEELERLSRIKDDFLANTSHELRTPLHGILGMTESVLRDPANPLAPSQRRSLDLVGRSARRLTRLVEDILDASRLRVREVELRLGPVDLVPLFESLPPHFLPALSGKPVELGCEVQEGVPPVVADEDRLVQILFNLVGNAAKYTDKGAIRIQAKRMDGRVEIRVSDTGPGIPLASRERIFEPFEQGEDRSRGGSGLGLSIAQKLVDLHGGRLEVDSEPGRGSTFRFRLREAESVVAPKQGRREDPARTWVGPAPVPASPVQQDMSWPASDGSEPVALAIDDEPVNLDVVRVFLEARGIRVVTAPSALHVVELVRAHRPSVVLLDVMMPHVDGLEACRKLREEFGSAELPILFLSARTGPDDILRGFASGADDYVPKPFLGQELVARVEAQIRRREAFAVETENKDIKRKMAVVVLERDRVLAARRHLTGFLQGMEDAVLVVDGSGTVRFANEAMAKRLGSTCERLAESRLWSLLGGAKGGEDLVEGRMTLRLKDRSAGMLDLEATCSRLVADGEELWSLVAESRPGRIESGSARNLLLQLGKGEEKLACLAARLDALRSDGEVGRPLEELNSALSRIRGLLADGRESDERSVLACEIMNGALELWTLHTGKGKIELAQESGLWSVHADMNGWRRAVTLDKYLDPAKVPRVPKWKAIQETVDFVRKLAPTDPAGRKLEEKLGRLSRLPS